MAIKLRKLGGLSDFDGEGDLDVLAVFESVVGDDAVLLHSAMQVGEHGRYSIIGFDILDKYVVDGAGNQDEANEALMGLKKKWDSFGGGEEDVDSGVGTGGDSNINGDFDKAADISYKGGYIGYFSYDFGVALAGIKQTVRADFKTPAMYFVLPSKFIVFDHKVGEVYAGILADKREIDDKEWVEDNFRGIVSKLTGLKDSAKKVCKNSAKAVSVRSNVTYEMYEKNIKKIKDYLVNGETYQVNYSQRFMADFTGDSWLAYKKFTRINPSPFKCFFNFENVKVVSNSPERLVCAKTVQNSSLKNTKLRLESRPIKGTVPRGKTANEEEMLAQKLLDSKKDAAELIMIVDLVRNDLGRVCEIGSVEVNELRVIEKYSHVQHTMSNVVGILREDKNWTDVIKTMFPGGSITGCPKYRTMQIIDELEEFKRGLYCGSAGYIGFDGQFDFNIMIRTLSVTGEKAYFNSGGGIVYDSTPESEYEETKDKAEALMRAVG